MITLHIEVDNVDQLHDQLARLLPAASAVPTVSQTPAPVEAKADVDADKVEPSKAKTSRGKKAPVDTAPTDNSGAAPAFIEEPAPEATAASTEEMSLDDMRKAMNDLAAKKGMPAVAKILEGFKQADGSPCQKASQVQPQERAVMAAKCEAAAKG